MLFVPTFKLVQRLLAAKKNFELESLLKKLDGFEAIIPDDLGYVEQSRAQMQVLNVLPNDANRQAIYYETVAFSTHAGFSPVPKLVRLTPRHPSAHP